MTQSTDFLAELAALAEKATPGPWEPEYEPMVGDDHATAICIPGFAGQLGTFIAHCAHNWNDAHAGERRISWKEAETNAALIVLLRNNLPAIIALGRERDELREALEEIKDLTRRQQLPITAQINCRARQALEGDNQ